jgi:hypothetical protein
LQFFNLKRLANQSSRRGSGMNLIYLSRWQPRNGNRMAQTAGVFDFAALFGSHYFIENSREVTTLPRPNKQE